MQSSRERAPYSKCVRPKVRNLCKFLVVAYVLCLVLPEECSGRKDSKCMLRWLRKTGAKEYGAANQ